jgi:hypothetical protein
MFREHFEINRQIYPNDYKSTVNPSIFAPDVLQTGQWKCPAIDWITASPEEIGKHFQCKNQQKVFLRNMFGGGGASA